MILSYENLIERVAANDLAVQVVRWEGRGETTDERPRALSEALRANTVVTSVQVAHSDHLTDEGVLALEAVLPLCNVDDVRLRFNRQVSAEAMKRVFKACAPKLLKRVESNDRTLTEVDWSTRGVDDSTLGSLAHALRGNTRVESVLLYINPALSSAGASKLIDTLPHCAVEDVQSWSTGFAGSEMEKDIARLCQENVIQRVRANDRTLRRVDWSFGKSGLVDDVRII